MTSKSTTAAGRVPPPSANYTEESDQPMKKTEKIKKKERPKLSDESELDDDDKSKEPSPNDLLYHRCSLLFLFYAVRMAFFIQNGTISTEDEDEISLYACAEVASFICLCILGPPTSFFSAQLQIAVRFVFLTPRIGVLNSDLIKPNYEMDLAGVLVEANRHSPAILVFNVLSILTPIMLVFLVSQKQISAPTVISATTLEPCIWWFFSKFFLSLENGVTLSGVISVGARILLSFSLLQWFVLFLAQRVAVCLFFELVTSDWRGILGDNKKLAMKNNFSNPNAEMAGYIVNTGINNFIAVFYSCSWYSTKVTDIFDSQKDALNTTSLDSVGFVFGSPLEDRGWGKNAMSSSIDATASSFSSQSLLAGSVFTAHMMTDFFSGIVYRIEDEVSKRPDTTYKTIRYSFVDFMHHGMCALGAGSSIKYHIFSRECVFLLFAELSSIVLMALPFVMGGKGEKAGQDVDAPVRYLPIRRLRYGVPRFIVWVLFVVTFILCRFLNYPFGIYYMMRRLFFWWEAAAPASSSDDSNLFLGVVPWSVGGVPTSAIVYLPFMAITAWCLNVMWVGKLFGRLGDSLLQDILIPVSNKMFSASPTSPKGRFYTKKIVLWDRKKTKLKRDEVPIIDTPKSSRDVTDMYMMMNNPWKTLITVFWLGKDDGLRHACSEGWCTRVLGGTAHASTPRTDDEGGDTGCSAKPPSSC